MTQFSGHARVTDNPIGVFERQHEYPVQKDRGFWTSGRLDTKTRTLLVEIDVDNTEKKLLAGSFVQVVLKIRTMPFPEIPAAALVMRGDKSFVATLTNENRVNFREVTIYESDGKTARLSSGLTEGEEVIVDLGESILDGQRVQPVRATKH